MLEVRSIQSDDAPACVSILNHTIRLGGTTAYEVEFTPAGFISQYVEGAPVCNVVLLRDRIVGFQAAFDDAPGVYSIASFTDRRDPVKGAGRALFSKTLEDCRRRGGTAILAKITADNSGGLAFYGRMGFSDWKVLPCDHTRSDGTQVDRIIKRYLL